MGDAFTDFVAGGEMNWWMAIGMEDIQYGLVIVRQLDLGGGIRRGLR